MPLKKPRNQLRIAVFIPCYKRPEYTKRCLESIDKAQKYKKTMFFTIAMPSLRKAIIKFFDETKAFDFLIKIDNDCLVPENWLNDALDVFEKTDVDILSPNVFPSNAAYKHGVRVKDLPYMPSKIIGGLWMMRREMVEGLKFADYDVEGIVGAFPILKQIIVEKEPKIGWLENVVFEDLGHWSGAHPEHLKTEEHKQYSQEVGRDVAWR